PIPPVQGTSMKAQPQSSKRRSLPRARSRSQTTPSGARATLGGGTRPPKRPDGSASADGPPGRLVRTSAQSSGDTARSVQPLAIGQPSRPSRIIQVGSSGGPGGGFRNGAVLVMQPAPSRRDRW